MTFKELMALPDKQRQAYIRSLSVSDALALAREGITEIDTNWDSLFEQVNSKFEEKLENDLPSLEETERLLSRVMKA